MVICRGIENVTGVGCHLSSAIVVLCYALVPLRNALLHILECHERAFLLRAQQSGNSEAGCVQRQQVVDPAHSGLVELAKLLQKMSASTDDEGSTAVDPTRVYKSFESQCNPYQLGDSTRALSMLLQKIRSLFLVSGTPAENENSDEKIAEAQRNFQSLYKYLLEGTMQQELVGKRTLGTTAEAGKKGSIEVRRKRKQIPLTCPFPLDGSSDSVSSAIHEATQPIGLRGYNWEGASDGYETWSELPDDTANATSASESDYDADASSDWETTKQISFGTLPSFLLFHLRRFSLVDGRLEASENVVDVPLRINIGGTNTETRDENVTSKPVQKLQAYKLVGGILHADEGDKEDLDYEGGHYVAVCRLNDDTVNDSTWCLFNDEKVTVLTQSVAMDVLAGRPNAMPDRPCMRGTLLVYLKESGDGYSNTLKTLEERFQESLSCMAEEGATFFPTKPIPTGQTSQPEDLVGNRLRIRWAKGKFYAGKVISYNETTGKHCVEYDDGDIREYKLHKKTIQWEDSCNDET